VQVTKALRSWQGRGCRLPRLCAGKEYRSWDAAAAEKAPAVGKAAASGHGQEARLRRSGLSSSWGQEPKRRQASVFRSQAVRCKRLSEGRERRARAEAAALKPASRLWSWRRPPETGGHRGAKPVALETYGAAVGAIKQGASRKQRRSGAAEANGCGHENGEVSEQTPKQARARRAQKPVL